MELNIRSDESVIILKALYISVHLINLYDLFWKEFNQIIGFIEF